MTIGELIITVLTCGVGIILLILTIKSIVKHGLYFQDLYEILLSLFLIWIGIGIGNPFGIFDMVENFLNIRIWN